MKKLLYLFPVLLLVVACEWDTKKPDNGTTDPNQVTEQPKTLPDPTGSEAWICIPGKQVGAITPNSSEKDLVQLFGAENIKREQLSLDEGVVVEGTIVYPGKPDQLIIEWLPGQLYQKPAIIRIEGEKSQWVTSQGIHIGTTLDQLLEINGEPISFFGFDWDYSGLVDDWGEGNVNSDLVVFLAPGNPDVIYPDLIGEQTFSSDHPKVKAAELYVISMMIPLNGETNPE